MRVPSFWENFPGFHWPKQKTGAFVRRGSLRCQNVFSVIWNNAIFLYSHLWFQCNCEGKPTDLDLTFWTWSCWVDTVRSLLSAYNWPKCSVDLLSLCILESNLIPTIWYGEQERSVSFPLPALSYSGELHGGTLHCSWSGENRYIRESHWHGQFAH